MYTHFFSLVGKPSFYIAKGVIDHLQFFLLFISSLKSASNEILKISTLSSHRSTPS
jgi:hypothetical protein